MPAPSHILVVLLKPGENERAHSLTIENTLEAFQALVGGPIKFIGPGPAWRGMHFYVNEEGKLRRLAPLIMYRSDLLVGPLVVSRLQHGEDVGLTSEEARFAIDFFNGL
jgi:Domain of unknown function (DUF3846)